MNRPAALLRPLSGAFAGFSASGTPRRLAPWPKINVSRPDDGSRRTLFRPATAIALQVYKGVIYFKNSYLNREQDLNNKRTLVD